MSKAPAIVPIERIASRILFIRAHRVMLDSDLAGVYGTTTKALNQAVKRNRHRFPADFMFQLTRREKTEVVTNCDHLRKLKYSGVANPFCGLCRKGGLLLHSAILGFRRVGLRRQYLLGFFYRPGSRRRRCLRLGHW